MSKEMAEVSCSALAQYFSKQKSAILLTSCIAEIIDNSIDARAKNIAVTIDPINLSIMVVDDGLGIRDPKQFWRFGNIEERSTIGAWGLGAKLAWASLVEDAKSTRMEFISRYKDGDTMQGWTSFKDLSDVNLGEFDREPLPPQKIGQGTELKITNISKKFRKLIRDNPYQIQSALGMIYKSSLQKKAGITMTVDIVEPTSSKTITPPQEVTAFDFTMVKEGEPLDETYLLPKDRSLHLMGYKICEEHRDLVKGALMRDSCSGVFAEYRGRILCGLDLRNRITMTNGLIVICTLEGAWITHPNKSESIQGDENDLCVDLIEKSLREWVEKNRENSASLKTNLRISKDLMMDEDLDCDCGDGDECDKTSVPAITRKGKKRNPTSSPRPRDETKSSSGDKVKTKRFSEIKLVRAELPETECAQWAIHDKVLTITICANLYGSADLDVWGPSAPFYRDVVECFARFRISEKNPSGDLFPLCKYQPHIEAPVKKKMVETKNRLSLTKRKSSAKLKPAKS